MPYELFRTSYSHNSQLTISSSIPHLENLRQYPVIYKHQFIYHKKICNTVFINLIAGTAPASTGVTRKISPVAAQHLLHLHLYLYWYLHC